MTTTRTTRTRTAVVAAAAFAGAGAILLASPGQAAGGPSTDGTTTWSCPGTGTAPADGTGMMRGRTSGDGGTYRNGPGPGMRGGMAGGMAGGMSGAMGDPAANLPAQGTLTAQQRTDLQAMAEEEKLAHDVYVALGAATGDPRFTRIAASEQRHLDAVRVLLDRYDLDDPTAGRAAGSFATGTVQDLYDRLVAQGRVSPAAALEVGRTVETTDIDDLVAARRGLTAQDVATVYARLEAASRHHLAAFGG